MTEFQPIFHPGLLPDHGLEPTWINNECIPCEDLFPNWANARNTLFNISNRIGDWILSYPSPSELVIQRIFPYNKIMAIIDKEEIPDVYWPLIETLWAQLIKDYSADLFEFVGSKQTKTAELSIVNKLKNRETFIIRCGGLNFAEEFQMRVGIFSPLFKRTIIK
jgi:hypothetical protein